MPSLGWIIAGRYLKRSHARGKRVHFITLSLFAIAAAAQIAYEVISRRPTHFSYATANLLQSGLKWAALGGLIAAVLIGFLILLLRHLTIFTAISTFGLFLGAAALVVVLSVMSGFEQDLKQKILGANAHITVTTPDHPFTDYSEIEKRIHSAVDGKATAFITDEVMISSQSNLAGVVLKGIEPKSAGDVTDLAKNLEQGSLDNLLHPEKLTTLGGPPVDLDDDLPDDLLLPAEKLARAKKKAGTGTGTGTGSGSGSGSAPPPKKPSIDLVPLDSHGKPQHQPEPPSPTRKVLPGVLVGRELAKSLRLYVGDDVNLISPMGDIGPTGPMPRSRAFRVAGVFYSGMYEYDSKYVYVSIAAAQKFLGTTDEITGFELRVADPDKTGPIVDKLKRTLGAGYEVADWQELNRNLFSALKVEKVAMFIVLCFIILVAGFSIIANGIMLVREKRREIAILKSMGATDRLVLGTFLLIGLYMGGIGIAAGIFTGVCTCLLLGRFGISLDSDVYYISKLPVQLNPYEISAVFAAAMAIVLCATLYPALAASKLRPVDGLRYDQT